MPSSSANFAAGMIFPRAMPAMSGMMASTSEIPWSRKNCWISLTIGKPFFGRGRSADAPLLPVFARRSAEGRKQRARKRIAHHLPLGMPLHGHRETLCVADLEGLHEPIGRPCLDRQPLAQAVYALRMEGVDRNPALSCEAV